MVYNLTPEETLQAIRQAMDHLLDDIAVAQEWDSEVTIGGNGVNSSEAYTVVSHIDRYLKSLGV